MYTPDDTSKLTRLKITDDKGFERVVLIDEDVFSIGHAASSGLRIPAEADDRIAALHAIVCREGSEYVLRDRSGSCGTRVNGRPVRCKVLGHGDRIRLGASRFQIEFLVEGSRSSDSVIPRSKILLQVLCDLHVSLNVREVSACAVASVMRLTDPIWTMLALDLGHGHLEVTTTAGKDATRLPASPTQVAREVMRTSRSYFQPHRICAAIVTREGPLGVLDLGPRVNSGYNSEDLELVESMAVHVGVALLNARWVESLQSTAGISRAESRQN